MRNKYVTAASVTGSAHYGREQQLNYLLHGPSHACWVIGNRRVGKTSLLRQLQLLALRQEETVPLFWDMQGVDSASRLGIYLLDTVHDSTEHFKSRGLALPSALPSEDAPLLLSILCQAAQHAGRELILLCDEPNVLTGLARSEPLTMQRLHNELMTNASLRVVFASTQSIYDLHDACKDWPVSFLAGFDLSQTIGPLTKDSAKSLISCSQSDEPVRVSVELSERLCDLTNNQPLLLQLLCSRLFVETGQLRTITEQDLKIDTILGGILFNNFLGLSDTDRRIVEQVGAAKSINVEALVSLVSGDRGQISLRVENLVRLGFLRRVSGQIAIGDRFSAHWMASSRDELHKMPTIRLSEDAMRWALAARRDHEARLTQAWRDQLAALPEHPIGVQPDQSFLKQLDQQSASALLWAEGLRQASGTMQIYSEYLLAGLFQDSTGATRQLLTLFHEDAFLYASLEGLSNLMSLSQVHIDEVVPALPNDIERMILSISVKEALRVRLEIPSCVVE